MRLCQNLYIHLIKRPIGFLGALVALIVSSPILIGTMAVLFFANRNGLHGIFFIQNRPGKGEKIFRVIKFKSMIDDMDTDGNLLPDEKRLTKVGKFIRSTSIDELPQLINILKGDMAFIGPRPLLVTYLPLYTPEQHRRHDVLPGISGWAQVNGRNLCKFSKKFEYDVWYVDHISLVTDIKIFYMTVMNVLRRKNVGEGAGNMGEMDDLHFAERMNLNNMFRVNNLLLRKPTHDDVDEILKLKNNEKAAFLLGGTFHTYTKDDIKHWIDFHNSNDDEVLLVVIDETAGKMIGHVGLYKIDRTSRKTEYGILIADDDSRGKGYGTLCTKFLVEYAFDKLGMNKVTAEVLSENRVSEVMFKKCGFKVDGVLRNDIFKNGRYYDVLSMSILQSEQI